MLSVKLTTSSLRRGGGNGFRQRLTSLSKQTKVIAAPPLRLVKNKVINSKVVNLAGVWKFV